MATCADILDRIDQIHAAQADLGARGLLTARIAEALHAAREALGSRVAEALHAGDDDPVVGNPVVKRAVAHGGKVWTYYRDRGHRLVQIPIVEATALAAPDEPPA